jgi:hypothetical protein
MSNLSKYNKLHALVSTIDVELESSRNGPVPDENRIVAALGGAVMTLGLQLVELADQELSEEQTVALLDMSLPLASATVQGWITAAPIARAIAETVGVDFIADVDVDIADIELFKDGLAQLPDYIADRKRGKPEPITAGE